MRVASRRAGTALGLLLAVAGCQSSTKRMPYDGNPILQSREPLLQPASAAAAAPAKRAEPTAMAAAPPRPVLQQVSGNDPFSAPQAKPTLTPVAAFAPAPPVPRLPMALLASAFEQPPAPAAIVPVSYTPAAKPSAALGHGPDYRWIVGVLDVNHRGAMELRYTDPSVDDIHGGKVRLEPDPRLAEFRPGDVLRIVGEIAVRPGDDEERPAWDRYPRYHARQVVLVERGR